MISNLSTPKAAARERPIRVICARWSLDCEWRLCSDASGKYASMSIRSRVRTAAGVPGICGTEAEIREVIQRGAPLPAKQVIERINAKAAGRVTYFRVGNSVNQRRALPITDRLKSSNDRTS
jgi:hypothetical protein